jgi:hypothetical protein
MARVARALAEALVEYAYSRSPDDKKRVAQLHTELCAEHGSELAQAAEQSTE